MYWWLLLLLCGWVNQGWAEGAYFLCGPDEDGCSPSNYAWCLCMPADQPLASVRYCLDFSDLSCHPIPAVSFCPSQMSFDNQGSCLAAAFQSEADPPCALVTRAFCAEHHIAFCDQDGGIATCR